MIGKKGGRRVYCHVLPPPGLPPSLVEKWPELPTIGCKRQADHGGRHKTERLSSNYGLETFSWGKSGWTHERLN